MQFTLLRSVPVPPSPSAAVRLSCHPVLRPFEVGSPGPWWLCLGGYNVYSHFLRPACSLTFRTECMPRRTTEDFRFVRPVRPLHSTHSLWTSSTCHPNTSTPLFCLPSHKPLSLVVLLHAFFKEIPLTPSILVPFFLAIDLLPRSRPVIILRPPPPPDFASPKG